MYLNTKGNDQLSTRFLSKLSPCPRQTHCCSSMDSRRPRLSFPLKSQQSWTGRSTKSASKPSRIGIWCGLWTISTTHVSPLPPSPLCLTSVQLLSRFDATSAVFQTCLRELKTVCGIHHTLPQSYTLPGILLGIDGQPIVRGYSGDVHLGFLNSSKVRVKRLFTSNGAGQNSTKVYHPHHRFPLFTDVGKTRRTSTKRR